MYIDVPDYAEIQVTSNFSFMRAASHPEELVRQAAAFGYKAIGIADRNSLSGVVRAHIEAKKSGHPPTGWSQNRSKRWSQLTCVS